MEQLRTFVAIDVEVGTLLKAKWDELKFLLKNDKIKWVDEHSLHLTLFFLGDTPINLVDNIAQKLELDLQGVTAFNIKLQGFGSFGEPSSPRVIWAGIVKSEPLNHLKGIVSNAISSMRFEEQDGDFSPHFTLGRVKQMRPSTELINFKNNNKSIIIQEAVVQSVIFYQSLLKPTGPVYKPLKTFRLPSL